MMKIKIWLLLGTLLAWEGASAAVPVRGRIDIGGDGKNRIALAPGEVTPGGTVGNASWGAPESRPFYLLAHTPVLPDGQWTRFSFSFTPEADGKVMLILKSMYAQTKGKKQQDRVWVCWDDLTVTGASEPGQKTAPATLPLAGDVPPAPVAGGALANGGFETGDSHNGAASWFSNPGATVVDDQALAHGGRRCVKVWCNGNFARRLMVKKGVKVTVTGYARPAGVTPAAE